MTKIDHEASYPRLMTSPTREVLGGLRGVVLQGPRQAGKTTLARQLAADCASAFVSLDDVTALEAARLDPTGFLASLPRPLFIDEFQRGGEAFILALKVQLDRHRGAGQFLLTGSTNFLTLPGLSESLAGRVALSTLWPLRPVRDRPDARRFHRPRIPFADGTSSPPLSTGPLRLLRTRRGRWFSRSHRTDSPAALPLVRFVRRGRLSPDVAELAEVRDGNGLRALVKLSAAQTAQELVLKGLADGIGVRPQTAARWLDWLESVFLVKVVPAWSPNPTRRVIHRPKLHFVDSGLCAHLLGKSGESLAAPTEPVAGALLETFVLGELTRLCGWSETRPRLYHLREHRGAEVDIIAEAPDGRVIAFEVKATQSRPAAGLENLVRLRERLAVTPGRFVHGFVLYTGAEAYSLGETTSRPCPLDALWGPG
jgi:predicted AAA+ superfamily ATPase